MLKSVLSFGFVILLNLSVQAQLDSYKYVLVPKKFDGFKYENQFRTSTQIKFLFSQNGYTAIYEDQIPPDLAEDPCKAVRVMLIDDSSLLATKVRLGLRDCNGAVVYESGEGKSKTKEYELAYREAINGAFKDLEELPYSYIPPEAVLESLAAQKDIAPAQGQPQGKPWETRVWLRKELPLKCLMQILYGKKLKWRRLQPLLLHARLQRQWMSQKTLSRM